jgi:hypothetical protein
LSTGPLQNRERLPVSEREVLIRRLTPELPCPHEVRIFQCLTPDASIEHSGQQFIAPPYADFATQEQPQFGEHRIDGPHLFAAATYLGFGTLSIGVMGITSDQKREERACISEQHVPRLRADRRDLG